jgi:hypothetical protein
LAAAAVGALTAPLLLLLTTSAARLLGATEVLHSGHRHACRETADQVLHVALARKGLLCAITALEHLCRVRKSHATEASLLTRAGERALASAKATTRGTVARNAGAGAHSPGGGGAESTAAKAAAAKATGLSKPAALAAKTSGLAKPTRLTEAALGHSAPPCGSAKLVSTPALRPKGRGAERRREEKDRRAK